MGWVGDCPDNAFICDIEIETERERERERDSFRREVSLVLGNLYLIHTVLLALHMHVILIEILILLHTCTCHYSCFKL